ncbi:MAG: DegQ family serine endoprotease, partial [Alphaproteobacteria bacterium]
VAPNLAEARAAPESFADLAEELTPAVVSISTESFVSGSGEGLPGVPEGTPFDEFFQEFFDRYGGDVPQESMPVSLGSGFIVDAEGYVVTNNHVIEEADKIVVILDDGTELEATLVGTDPKTDIALLKVDAGRLLPFVGFGNSDVVRVGDWALAIGNPFGFGSSVTAGIISARQRDIRSGPYDDFLQTDAPINRGNSGGPLFNMDGEVVGVNTAIYSPSGGSVGIGFAVPSNLVSRVVDQLKEFGRTRRGWLGVRIQSITPEIAEAFGLPGDGGALVASVTPDGPAEGAGLEAGDVIVRFNGTEITEMRELPRAVADTDVGRAAEVIVIRNGEEMTFDVVLGELEEFEQQLASGTDAGQDEDADDKQKPVSNNVLGMVVRPATPELAQQMGLDPNVAGLIVTDLEPGSPAMRAGILPGDLVLEVGKETVDTVEAMAEQVEAARDRESRSIVVRIERNGDAQYLAVQLGE